MVVLRKLNSVTCQLHNIGASHGLNWLPMLSRNAHLSVAYRAASRHSPGCTPLRHGLLNSVQCSVSPAVRP